MIQQYVASTPLTSFNTTYNTNSSKQLNKSNYNSNRPVELEVNISVGKNKYLLCVQKCSNLHNEVQNFLKTHKINLKYEAIILSMVREELAKKQKQKQIKNRISYQQKKQNEDQMKLLQLKQVKYQIDTRKKIMSNIQKNQQTQEKRIKQQLWQKNDEKGKSNSIKTSTINISRQNKQNYLSHNNSKSNHRLSTEAPNISKEQNIPSQNEKDKKQMSSEQLKSQNVYEKWKVKQKLKEKERVKNVNTATPNKTQKFQRLANRSFVKEKQKQKQQKANQKQKQKSKSKSQKKLEVHSPDYFYNKGLKFKQTKEDHIQQMYKEKYPFQLSRDASITPSKKKQLHDRLYKEHKVKIEEKNERKLCQLLNENKQESRVKTATISIDKYKRKVMQRNNKINEALNYLIQNKMIQNPYKIQAVSKSPFRNS